MDPLNSNLRNRTALIAAAVGWLQRDTARAVREQVLAGFAHLYTPTREQLLVAASEQIAQMRQQFASEALMYPIASMRQIDLLIMREQAIRVACPNQYLSSLATGHKPARSLKLVPGPSDEQDLGEIG